MFTMLKKAALVGLGLTEQAKETVSALAKKGEENQSEEAVRLKALFESAEKGERECSQKLDDLCQRIAGGVKLPMRADIDRLKKEVADLTAEVNQLKENRG